MLKSIHAILNNTKIYKRCSDCGWWNHSKNEQCIKCGSEVFDALTDNDVYDLKLDLQDYGNILMEV